MDEDPQSIITEDEISNNSMITQDDIQIVEIKNKIKRLKLKTKNKIKKIKNQIKHIDNKIEKRHFNNVRTVSFTRNALVSLYYIVMIVFMKDFFLFVYNNTNQIIEE
jgi:hypothetical protein